MKKYLKKFSAVLLVLSIISPSLNFSANVAHADGYTGAGTGVLGDPFVITNCTELQEMNLDLNSYFILGNDIDCSATNPDSINFNAEGQWGDGKGFDPIGTVTLDGPNIYNGFTFESFTGSLDGQNHKISTLYINRGVDGNDIDGYYDGLFSTISSGAEVKNLGLEDVDISASGNETGALAGGLSGTVTNVYSTGRVNGNYRAGGLVGVHVDADSFPNSSPLVYTWNGSKYIFTDDVGGILPKELSGVDIAQIDAKDMALKDNKYSMKISEEYNEIAYYDKLALMTFDHQAGYSVVEPLDVSAGVGELRTVSDTPTHPLIGCTDEDGNDCTDALKSNDNSWSYTNINNFYDKKNLKKSFILDFGDLSNATDVELVMRGARDYAASKKYPGNSGRSIQVKDADGNWVEIYNKNELGSDGSPRLRTVNLTGKFLSNDYHVKVSFDTFNANYFAVDTSLQVPFTSNTYDADSVNLGYHGFTAIDRSHYYKHDYDKVSPLPDSIFKNQYGNFTKYGDVTPLLNSADDHYVIMRAGDELSVEFPYVAPAEGMVRSYMLYNDVLYKHATNDNLGVLGQSAGYLPYHSMTKYSLDMTPYPQTPENIEYQNTWNTRVFAGPFPDALRAGSSTIIDSHSSASVNGTYEIGGLVGDNEKEIRNSYFDGSISACTGNCGGIAGSNYGQVNKSYFNGSMNLEGSSTLGGIAGYNYGDIHNSYSISAIIGATQIGGIVGVNYNTVENSYSTGDITGTENIGGIIGVDASNNNYVTNSFSTGNVANPINSGGLIGVSPGEYDYSSLFWYTDSQTLGVGNLAVDDPKQPTKAANADYFKGTSITSHAPFTAWDFSETPVWYVQANDYPNFVVSEIPAPTHHESRVSSIGSYAPGYGPRAYTAPVVTTPSSSPKFQFMKNLNSGMTDSDVLELQKFLNTNGYEVSAIGGGSAGHETNYFGNSTKNALIKFQKANNIAPSVGFFGQITRGVVNNLIK